MNVGLKVRGIERKIMSRMSGKQYEQLSAEKCFEALFMRKALREDYWPPGMPLVEYVDSGKNTLYAIHNDVFIKIGSGILKDIILPLAEKLMSD